MENKSIFGNNPEEVNNNLGIDIQSIEYLRVAGKWAKFLAIIGFIVIGLLVLFSLFAGALFSFLGAGLPMGFPGYLITLFYLIGAAIALPPSIFLFKFSVKIKNAIQFNKNDELRDSLKNLKSYFMYNGIIAIIVISIYVIAFISMIAGAMMVGASTASHLN